MKKILILLACIIFSVSSFSLGVSAQTYGYMTKETVSKTSASAAFSNSTGSNSFGVLYAAGRIDNSLGTLSATVQGYSSGSYIDLALSTYAVTGSINSSPWSYTDPTYSIRVFRLKLHGTNSNAEGWVQGRG